MGILESSFPIPVNSTTMSEFSKLKAARKLRETKSYVGSTSHGSVTLSSSDVVSTTDSPANISNAETSQAVTTVIETGDLYRPLNSALEVRVSNDEKGRGRGVFSKFLRKPGKFFFWEFPYISIYPHYNARRRSSLCKTQRCSPFGPTLGRLLLQLFWSWF